MTKVRELAGIFNFNNYTVHRLWNSSSYALQVVKQFRFSYCVKMLIQGFRLMDKLERSIKLVLHKYVFFKQGPSDHFLTAITHYKSLQTILASFSYLKPPVALVGN